MSEGAEPNGEVTSCCMTSKCDTFTPHVVRSKMTILFTILFIYVQKRIAFTSLELVYDFMKIKNVSFLEMYIVFKLFKKCFLEYILFFLFFVKCLKSEINKK